MHDCRDQADPGIFDTEHRYRPPPRRAHNCWSCQPDASTISQAKPVSAGKATVLDGTSLTDRFNFDLNWSSWSAQNQDEPLHVLPEIGLITAVNDNSD